MCSPAAVGIGLAVASTASQMYAQHQAGAENDRQMREQGRLLEAQRMAVLEQGNEVASRARSEGAAVQERATVVGAASGVDVTSGSSAEAVALSGRRAELDALIARNNAARQAWGLGLEADALERRRKQISDSSWLGYLGTGLQGAAQMYSIYDAGNARAKTPQPRDLSGGTPQPLTGNWFTTGRTG